MKKHVSSTCTITLVLYFHIVLRDSAFFFSKRLWLGTYVGHHLTKEVNLPRQVRMSVGNTSILTGIMLGKGIKRICWKDDTVNILLLPRWTFQDFSGAYRPTPNGPTTALFTKRELSQQCICDCGNASGLNARWYSNFILVSQLPSYVMLPDSNSDG